MLGVLHGAYDAWLTTDVEGQKSWDREYELDWAMSLIRQEHPYLKDEEFIQILAEKRLSDGYYDKYDF